jgi:hypothetical protein
MGGSWTPEGFPAASRAGRELRHRFVVVVVVGLGNRPRVHATESEPDPDHEATPMLTTCLACHPRSPTTRPSSTSSAAWPSRGAFALEIAAIADRLQTRATQRLSPGHPRADRLSQANREQSGSSEGHRGGGSETWI